MFGSFSRLHREIDHLDQHVTLQKARVTARYRLFQLRLTQRLVTPAGLAAVFAGGLLTGLWRRRPAAKPTDQETTGGNDNGNLWQTVATVAAQVAPIVTAAMNKTPESGD